jgi:hypothetical protein
LAVLREVEKFKSLELKGKNNQDHFSEPKMGHSAEAYKGSDLYIYEQVRYAVLIAA